MTAFYGWSAIVPCILRVQQQAWCLSYYWYPCEVLVMCNCTVHYLNNNLVTQMTDVVSEHYFIEKQMIMSLFLHKSSCQDPSISCHFNFDMIKQEICSVRFLRVKTVFHHCDVNIYRHFTFRADFEVKLKYLYRINIDCMCYSQVIFQWMPEYHYTFLPHIFYPLLTIGSRQGMRN